MPDLSWDYVYLLGWFDQTGRSYLTTWDGDHPMIHVVVTGVSPIRMPLWRAPVPPNAKLHLMPEGLTHKEFVDHARSIGGYYAFGWYLEEFIDRTPKERRAASV